MATTKLPANAARLAALVRDQFVRTLAAGLPALSEDILDRLQQLVDQSESTKVAQERRDLYFAFSKSRGGWAEQIHAAWRKAAVVRPVIQGGAVAFDIDAFELIGDDVVENRIHASRIALFVMEAAGSELNDLKTRLLSIEGGDELTAEDILRPERMCYLLVEQWSRAGFAHELWPRVQDLAGHYMGQVALRGFSEANQMLVDNGVMPDIGQKFKVKRAAEGALPEPRSTTQMPVGGGGRSTGYGGRATQVSTGPDTRVVPTELSPMGRAKVKAQGVLGNLKRFLTEKVADYEATRAQPMSPGLTRALAASASRMGSASSQQGAVTQQGGPVTRQQPYQGTPAQVAAHLRTETTALKRETSSASEKATIEIVALMFQSILAEERIPDAVRLLFARLQIPVLRVALGEPEFFGTLHHPARKLIDHMGSCAMGFDAGAIQGSGLEIEIRRIVNVVEQYPETGRKVFQIVYDDFTKFLNKSLTGQGSAQRVVSMAQQMEMKETLTVQFTIELRKLLADIPVPDSVREFLFKVWTEVLAVAAVKNGAKHHETLLLKQAAADVVWAAGSKANRGDRAKVIQELPKLLQQLRHGMTLAGLTPETQEVHVKTIGDALAQAFMSKTAEIPRERVDAMAERLADLEEVAMDDPSEMNLDAHSLEMLVGIDATELEVISDGGANPSEATRAWAQELQPGTWFTIDHNSRVVLVQYAWRSARGHLHLFSTTDGFCYLIQSRRLASYLQAGLLSPKEDESITVRATRDALNKLEANPERIEA